MPAAEWVGQSLRDDDNAQSNTSRLLNLYRERHGDKFILKSVLGTSVLVDLPGVFMRAMSEIGGQLHAVTGGKVYKVTNVTGETELSAATDLYEVSGPVASTELATVNDAADTTIEGNNGAVTVSAGGEYYNIASNGTVTTPTTGAFSSVGSVSFLGQRTVITEKNGRRFGWSDVADSTTFDALDFATAESEDDNILRGLAIGSQYWIFGERSIERWYLSGSANTSEFLLPISGGAIDTGLKAFGLISDLPNGAFFVGDDNIVYLISGGTMQPISTRGVETAIVQSTPEYCFYYEDEGHKICVIQFRDRPAWSFDISNNEWHERSEGREFGPWTATASARSSGFWFVGTSAGQIRRLERSNREANGPLWRRAMSTTLENDGKRFTINRLQVQPVSGSRDVPATPTLNLLENGTFDSDLSGWTAQADWSWSSGKAVLSSSGLLNSGLLQDFGSRDRVKAYAFTSFVSSGNGIRVQAGDSTSENSSIVLESSAGSGTFFGVMPVGYDRITFFNSEISGSLEATLDNVTVRLLDPARAPKFMIRLSRDRGKTWGRERWRDTGRLGDYDRLTTLRGLGRFRRATAELTMTDPVDIPFTSLAFLDISA